MLISLGSDMEVFGVRKDGHHVALCGKIGGDKENPKQVEGLPPGFMIQEDNVALEFNIPICYSRAEFVGNMRIMRQYTSKLLNSLDLELSTKASVSFDIQELTHPNANIFGCEPDYDAWKKVENSKPVSEDKTLRASGGHVHVGADVDMVKGVRLMDLFVGVPSVLIDNSPESRKRRELYGKAGAMRPKPYGFEYRVLSNFWMFSDTLVRWVYNQTSIACESAKVMNLSTAEGKRIQKCINTGDEQEAIKIVNDYNILLPSGG